MRHHTQPTHAVARTQPPGHRSDAGLSLVEMVVAIGIVMVVLTSALSVFVLAKKSQQTAEGTDQASQIGYEQIERIRQLDWTDIGFRSDVWDATTYGATLRGATSTTNSDWANNITLYAGEEGSHVKFNPVGGVYPFGDTDIKPYRTVKSHNNTFYVYTAITFGRDTSLSLPATSATTGAGQYTFKRVTVTTRWQAAGNGPWYEVVAESWFAPEAEDAVPPGVPCFKEEDLKECTLP